MMIIELGETQELPATSPDVRIEEFCRLVKKWTPMERASAGLVLAPIFPGAATPRGEGSTWRGVRRRLAPF
jgi:hypothetical protein